MRLWPPRLQPWPQNNFGPPNIGPPPTTDPHPATDPPTLSPPPFGRGGCCRLNQPATAPLPKNFKVHGGTGVDQFSRQQPPSLSDGGTVVGQFSRQQPPLVYVVLHHRTWPGQIILFLICTVYLILTAECWAGMEATA
jgi:hypothetical protein